MKVPVFRSAPRVDNVLKVGVVFFCKDCEKIVDVKPVGRKFVYKCAICDTKNVAFGTEKAVKNFFRIKGSGDAPPEISEDEKRAMKADKL